VTFDPDFKVTTCYSTLNISETTRDGAIVTIERQQEVVCALSNCDISNDLDKPLIQFTRSLEVNLKKSASYGQVSIEY